jgi:fibronectin type 3 domain-containing protein
MSCSVVLLLAALPAWRAGAQDPIIKPTTGTITTTGDRLPAPTPIVVKQLADGRIQVSWKRLSAAQSYALWRSVPPAGVVALSERPTDTVYVDSDVKAGSWYYYNVAAVGEGGTIGLKGGGSLQATISAGTTTTTTTTTTATRAPVPVTVEARGGLTYLVSWNGTLTATRYDIRRLEYRPSAADSLQPDGSSPRVTTFAAGSSRPWEFRDSLPSSTAARLLAWDVTVVSPFNNDHARTPFVYVPASATVVAPTTTTTSVATPTTVAPTAEVTLAVGGSASLAERTGVGGAQWLSFDVGVASVGTDGTVTGRAAGIASVAALARQSDGSVRVTVVRVLVQ